MMGMCRNELRLPLIPMQEANQQKLADIMRGWKLIYPTGSRGRLQTFVCFHSPLVASAGAKSLRQKAQLS